MQFAASLELKIFVIGEALEGWSEALFLFPKYAKGWDAALEGPISEVSKSICQLEVLSSFFDVADDDISLEALCRACYEAGKCKSFLTALIPYFD